MPAKLERCVAELTPKYGRSRAYAICTAAVLGKAAPLVLDIAAKARGLDAGEPLELRAEIVAKDASKRRVYGYAYVTHKADGSPVADHSGEVILPADLEEAQVGYMTEARGVGTMHRAPGAGQVIECAVLTAEKKKAMGVEGGPCGMWLGVQVTDEATWRRVEAGELRAFSVGGLAVREALTAEEARGYAGAAA